jgi:predicted PolB exonuclease-like 3'-5' exonuclease
MLDQYNPEHILFIDIETVPAIERYDMLPDAMKKLWDRKAERLPRGDRLDTDSPRSPSEMYERAGIYAEFGKIICISTGIVRNQTLWIKSYSGDDEKQVLIEFSALLNKVQEKRFQYLCAHNGKEFDYPYLIRRMLIHGIPIPDILEISGKKPWEVNLLDTMELWKFGDYKSYTSLELLAAVFKIPTPKDDMEGQDVARVYWQDHNLERIVNYCQKDVITIVNILLKLQGKPVVPEKQIQYVGA